MIEPKHSFEEDFPSLDRRSSYPLETARLIDTLKQVCESTDWEYGEAWTPNADNTVLELSPAWYVSTQVGHDRQLAWRQFRYCSEEFVLHPGEGLPGRVWSSQTPLWITDVSAQSESYFLRNQIAKAFGARAGLGLLITPEQSPIVLAFFMSANRMEDQQLIRLTAAIATQPTSLS